MWSAASLVILRPQQHVLDVGGCIISITMPTTTCTGCGLLSHLYYYAHNNMYWMWAAVSLVLLRPQQHVLDVGHCLISITTPTTTCTGCGPLHRIISQFSFS